VVRFRPIVSYFELIRDKASGFEFLFDRCDAPTTFVPTVGL
jgi:hypothetical protein